MIYLENNYEDAITAVSELQKKGYLSVIIILYLDSYGCDYQFQETFLQKINDKITAIILRYNSKVYCLSDKESDYEELLSFSERFLGCEFISDIPSNILKDTNIRFETLYDMQRSAGSDDYYSNNDLKVNDNVTHALGALREYLDSEEYEDFLLNNSFQHRHKLLDVYVVYADDQAVSVSGVTKTYSNQKAITFLYTKEHFRGNKYANQLLDNIINDSNSDVHLICEEQNLNFYINNKFKLFSELSLINL